MLIHALFWFTSTMKKILKLDGSGAIIVHNAEGHSPMQLVFKHSRYRADNQTVYPYGELLPRIGKDYKSGHMIAVISSMRMAKKMVGRKMERLQCSSNTHGDAVVLRDSNSSTSFNDIIKKHYVF